MTRREEPTPIMSSSSVPQETTPLISAAEVSGNNTQNDAAIAQAIAHEFNSYEEYATEIRKGTRQVEARAWDDYYRDPNHESFRYSVYRGPNGDVVMRRNEIDELGPDPGLIACFWLMFLLFLLAIIIVPFYL